MSAEQISAADAVNIARLASLRYWDVLAAKQLVTEPQRGIVRATEVLFQ